MQEILNFSPLVLLKIIVLLTVIGIIISDLEWFSLNQHFKSGGIFSWSVQRAKLSSVLNKRIINIFDLLFSFPNIKIYFIIRFLMVFALICSFNNITYFAIFTLLLYLTSIIYIFKGSEGSTGADAISLIILMTGSLSFFSDIILIHQIALIFIACQLILAYSTSGWIRIVQTTWTNGSDLLSILRQHTYGNYTIWRIIKDSKFLPSLISTSILIFECSSVIVPFLPLQFLYVFVAIGVLFHLSTAILMGLNNFVFAFVPPYIAYIWISCQINICIY